MQYIFAERFIPQWGLVPNLWIFLCKRLRLRPSYAQSSGLKSKTMILLKPRVLYRDILQMDILKTTWLHEVSVETQILLGFLRRHCALSIKKQWKQKGTWALRTPESAKQANGEFNFATDSRTWMYSKTFNVIIAGYSNIARSPILCHTQRILNSNGYCDTNSNEVWQ
jgi:hypothetical protein